MLEHLTQYFAQKGQLIFPNIGVLQLEKEEASWETAVLLAPKEKIVFNQSSVKPSNLFYQFLSEQLSVSTDLAMIQYQEFLDHAFSADIAALQIGNFGTLSKQMDTYSWSATFDSNLFYKNIDIAPQEMAAQQNVKTKGQWYWWAIFLALVAIISILYKSLSFE
ncbi:MAG: hypothetical protein NT104_00960 [Bacteroidetes bacterium]|nr:hypothetical protein [Bacteroidota bacterium]